MIARIYIRINVDHFPGLIDQHTDSARMPRFGISTRPIRHPERPVSIAENGKVEGILFGKCRVLLNAVETGADNRDMVLIE